MTDAKLIRRNNTAVTMIFGQSAPWTVFLLPFLEQFDGNSCGPIACLKLMEIYRVITAKEIKASDKSYREIVFNHQARMVTNLNSELLVTERVKKEDICRDTDVICLCVNPRHTAIDKMVQNCCNVAFHSQCLAHHFTTSDRCPYCMSKCMSTPTQTPSMNLPTEKATATTSMNDIVREESVRKRRVLQDEQGEKMKKRHIQNLKDIGSKVEPGAVVTLYVDPRVASHARGVTAVVVACCKDTGGILACSPKGIIVNGTTRKEWWIASDGYKMQSLPGVVYSGLPPDLLLIQKAIIDGSFHPETHPKCTLGEAHQQSVGASSPCNHGKCGCKKGKCTARCGCLRKNVSCSSSCSCSGNCAINPKNDKNQKAVGKP